MAQKNQNQFFFSKGKGNASTHTRGTPFLGTNYPFSMLAIVFEVSFTL